ncbi:MAG: sterol desaturase family protein [Chitinophagales bacterium]
MEAYATALTYAIPGFTLLIILEAIAAYFMNQPINRAMDTISSLSSGMTNTIKSLLGLSIIILSYEWMVDHFALFEINSPLWLYILAFFGIDFASYWSHRFNHSINLFWNRHVVHHSSEEFNLSCALRQEISAFIGVYFFLYIPLAIIGVPAKVIAIVSPLHLFAQFWYHTRLINKMGWLEYIIVTPSHHRVHHAINEEYIDKNFGTILIVWDRFFGTFQKELADVPPVYGTLKQANTWNPVIINFLHFWQLVKDAWHAQNWWDKLRIWFMPTGWRPVDVQNRFPIETVTDVYSRPKYAPETSNFLRNWSWFQLSITNALVYYALASFASFDYVYIVLYLICMFITIFAYTSLMDKHPIAMPAELLKLTFGLGLIYLMNGWYGLDDYLYGASVLVTLYFLVSAGLTAYFLFFEKRFVLKTVSK